MKDVGNAPRGEKRIYFAVLAAIPLLAVRILWSILAAFADNSTFSIQGGKPLVQLFMAILEEFGIVVMYTLTGLTISNGEAAMATSINCGCYFAGWTLERQV
jgi:hypothetical protein